MDEMRLQKYLAESGTASRRKAEELIKQGRVSVNGKVVTEMGVKVFKTDSVKVDGKAVGIGQKRIYIMLNKPAGYVTTVRDQFSRKTVIDLVSDAGGRIYPVGRLDYDTSGLLILTNDGDLTYRLTHPGHEVKKVYRAEIRGVPDKRELEEFENGLRIEDYVTAPAGIRILDRTQTGCIAEITIHEGRNRQVRKMCEAIGHPVVRLARTGIGSLRLGDLDIGQWRYLTDEEINRLYKID